MRAQTNLSSTQCGDISIAFGVFYIHAGDMQYIPKEYASTTHAA